VRGVDSGGSRNEEVYHEVKNMVLFGTKRRGARRRGAKQAREKEGSCDVNHLGVVRVLPAQTQPNDVRGGVREALGQVRLAQPRQRDVQRDRRQQLVVLDLAAVLSRTGATRRGMSGRAATEATEAHHGRK